MIKRTLALRPAIVLVVVLSLLVPALLTLGYARLIRYGNDIQKQTRILVERHADALASSMPEPLWNLNHASGKALIDATMDRNEDIVRIEVRDLTHGVFALRENPERRAGYTVSTGKAIRYQGNDIGSIRVEISSNQLRKAMIASLTEQMTVLAVQAVFSIALVLILLEIRVIRPLQQLGKGAERLAGQQLDVPFTWKRLDEIGLLSQRLDITRISLHKLFEELNEDIDKRKHIEKELQRREERFRTVVEQSPIAIIEWDQRLHVIEWNAAATRIFGYAREQALGRHASFLLPHDIKKEDNTVSQGATPRATNNIPKSSINITENLRADGSIIVCQWSNTSITEEAGTTRLLSMAEDITEKRRAEEAQRLSEAKFYEAFQCNPDSGSITRLSDGCILDVNQTFEKTTGFSRTELFGKNAIQLNLWVDLKERNKLIAQLKEYKVVQDFPWSMRTRHGEIRKCLSNSNVFHVGQELYMLSVFRDVTDKVHFEEQKAQADHALMRLAQGAQGMASESFFQLLVDDLASALRIEHAFIGVRLSEAPDYIRTIAAHERGRLTGNFEYLTRDSPCESILAGEIHLYSSGIQTRFPNDLSLINEGWDSYAGAPLHDAAGHTVGLLAVMDSKPLDNPDLVKSLLQVFSDRASAELERKRTEQALRTSEQRFSTMFQSSPVAMFVTHLSENHIVKDVNSAFESLMLHPRESIIGKTTVELALYRDNAVRATAIEELQRAGTIQNQEIWMSKADGSMVLVQLSGHTFVLSNETFAILAFQDVTDQRRIEDEIRELNATLEERVIERTEELQQANQELAYTLETLNMAQEELVRSEKLAALGSLVAGIAHELNTPIGNSLMVASTLFDQTRILSDSYATDQGIKRSTLENYIADANTASNILVRNLFRAANLVTSFKQVAMDQTSSQRRTFSLAEVISEIVLTLWPTLKKTACEVNQNIPHTLMLDSYPGPLGQVLTNLLNNALLHAFDGRGSGNVTITAHAGSEGWVELIVKDDGIGIPANNLNRIFDPFFTTKLGAGGSGLGLNITHNIVSGLLGGRIRVQSEVGIGTTFFISLPAIAPHKTLEEDPARIKSPMH